MSTPAVPERFVSLYQFEDNLYQAKSVKFGTKNITFTTNDHKVKKIARTQLDELATKFTRDTLHSNEEKLECLEKIKLKLRERSQENPISSPNQESEDIISDLEGIEEFMKKEGIKSLDEIRGIL